MCLLCGCTHALLFPQRGAVWLLDWCQHGAGMELDDSMMGAVCRVLLTGALLVDQLFIWGREASDYYQTNDGG